MKTFLALLILASSAFAQQPLQFHGLALGQSVSTFKDCLITPKTPAEITADDFGYWRGIEKTKAICAGGPGSFAVNVKQLEDGRIDEDDVVFKNGRVSSIAMSMHKQTFENVVADMTAKLGRKPDSTEPKVLQNAFGAKWSFNRAIWVGDVMATVEDAVDDNRHPVATGVDVVIADGKPLPVENRASSL